jgi:prolipoprotein diacylglyceryl transferase
MIAFGVLAGVWLAARRFKDRSLNSDHGAGIAMWGVPAGIVGARLYHVVTDWSRFSGNWGEAIKIWNGGLGILGGVIFGIAATFIYCRRADLDVRTAIDVFAPSIALAQMIGRWGNWFNQELFGRPTDVPWALRIDPEHRPTRYIEEATFHPTFLYESLWNLMVVIVLLQIDRTKRLSKGMLFVAYFALYSAGRLWVEALRIDEATMLAGVRINIWVFSCVFFFSLGLLIDAERKARKPEVEEPI